MPESQNGVQAHEKNARGNRSLCRYSDSRDILQSDDSPQNILTQLPTTWKGKQAFIGWPTLSEKNWPN
jgi:hypothetical protein